MSDERENSAGNKPDWDSNKINIATLRLNKAEKIEFENLPEEIKEKYQIKTATDFFNYKLRHASKEQLGEINENIKSFTSSLKNPAMSQDLVRVTKMEMELEQLRKDNALLLEKNATGLGELPALVNKKVEEELHKIEFEKLKNDLSRAEITIKEKDLDLRELSSKLAIAEDKLNTVALMKELAPHVGPLAKGIVNGAKNSANGGGLMGFLSGLGEMDMSGGGGKLSPEDEKSLDLGRTIYSLFNEHEANQIIALISMISTKKEIIPLVLQMVNDEVNPK